MFLDPRLERLDANRVRIANPHGVDAVLFANRQVPVESSAVNELVGMLDLQETVERYAEASSGSFDIPPRIERVAVTPDFHKARGIPVGTVLATRGFAVPQAIGNDINCGMRLHLTSLGAEEVVENRDRLETAFRHIFFEGGRNIPMSRPQREALFTEGLAGLIGTTPKALDEGLWSIFHELDVRRDLNRVEFRGSLKSALGRGLDAILGPVGRLSRDGQIGSIGGGNHFVEIQHVERIIDGTTARAWGLTKDMVTVMVHSGSLAIGHQIGGTTRDGVRDLFPATLGHPSNGIFILPRGERCRGKSETLWNGLYNAANFAFANRMFLAMMALSGLRQIQRHADFPLLYDAPHNFLWRESQGGEELVIHRKGACPACGFEAMAGTPFAYTGEPVLVPGSMGASSFVLAGCGNAESLWSASHGAGRSLSRGDALKGHDAEFRQFLENFRVVTPVDLRRQDIKLRRDIVEKKLEEIKQEAPYAYKGIDPIIQTLTDAGMARPVVELKPLMTIKG